ncbi:MAG: type I-B CRISPR-associated protein Cas7/Cst2/DevR [Thermotogae bacterium]|nr:type I-B CRISPR-associated protein Cas7/Cst2/DevR [Thermotogota bacterium]
MRRKGLTITYIVKAFPMNYDEGYGNVAVMKKVHRGDGSTLPFTSRQALRYSLTQWLFDNDLWEEAKLRKEGGGDKAVIQYDPNALKEKFYEEADLFGYMLTEGKNKAKTRPAVARLTHLIGLDPYFGDQEFLNNMGFANRLQKQTGERVDPNIANVETAYTYYRYTLNVDLDLVGEDENFGHSLPIEEKIRRVKTLIEATKYLYRDIRGRREDLKPLAVVGGVYPVKNPFFQNSLGVRWSAGHPYLTVDSLRESLEITLPTFVGGKRVIDFTFGGVVAEEFANAEAFKELGEGFSFTPSEALDKIGEEVERAYKG